MPPWIVRVDEETGKLIPNPWRMPPDIEDLTFFDDCETYAEQLAAKICASGRFDPLLEDTETEYDILRQQSIQVARDKGSKPRKRPPVRNAMKDGRAAIKRSSKWLGTVMIYNPISDVRKFVRPQDLSEWTDRGWIPGFGPRKSSK